MRDTEYGKRTGSHFSRLSIVIALSTSALLSAVGPVHAAPAAKAPVPADIPDYQAALDAMHLAAIRDGDTDGTYARTQLRPCGRPGRSGGVVGWSTEPGEQPQRQSA
ncbi:hypothetical protein ACIQWN_23855 [Streptomyces vinaceus]|uniref:hypothetical protein n=1 Tax=Streptomyces vinaceus TaxID=1960 RepID=UPI00382FF7ED